MSPLLVQSCSKSKQEPDKPVQALDLYSGFFYNIIKKAKREGEIRSDIDICILSAEHGLIDSDTEIEWYDRRMDSKRAKELAPKVKAEFKRRVEEEYELVIINAGEAYRKALTGVEDTVNADVHYIEGDGIGYKGHALKRIIRGDFEPLTNGSTPTMETQ